MEKLKYIDALRGLAILGVLMVHANEYGSLHLNSYLAGKIIGQGAKGVQLFYLASAFTLFLSFNSRMVKEKFPVKNFFLRRFFRIAPMYYLGIAYYLVQDGLGPRYWLGDETHITGLNIMSNITFLHGFNPYWITSLVPGGWSIAIEMTFYAFLPFLFFKIKNLNQAFNFLISCLILRLLFKLFFSRFQLITDDNLWHHYLFFYFPSQLPIFALGILLYFIVSQSGNFKMISWRSVSVFSGLVLLQLVNGVDFFPIHIIFGICFLFLGLFLSKYRFKIIVNPIIMYIGKISFSMYLVHFAILHWLSYFNFIDYFNNEILNYITKFFIVLILTIAISTLLYKIIEVPFQEMGKKIIKKLENN
jgi:peptidoglycan/LPS O-acetylase OafA/YrhL